MNDCLFTGAATALVTPFLNGAVNYPLFERLLRRQVDAGIEAVVVAGTTGESPTLSDEEKLELFTRAKDYVGNSCKIIAGTGSNSTIHTIDLSMAAEKCGVDGLLVVTPYYNKATPEGLFAHFASVAHSVNIPIVLYNVPSRTGVDIPVEIYQYDPMAPDDLFETFKANWLSIPMHKKKEVTKIRTVKQIETIDKAVLSDNLHSMIELINYPGIGIKTMECCFKVVMHYAPEAKLF